MGRNALKAARRAFLSAASRSELLRDREVTAALASAGFFNDPELRRHLAALQASIGATGGVLSNTAIWEAIQDGRIEVNPKPPWHTTPGEESHFDVDSLTVHLGPTLIELPDIDLEVDISRANFKGVLQKHGRRIELGPNDSYRLRPGQRILGQLAEHIKLASTPRPEFEGRPLLCADLSGLTRNARFFIGIELANQLHCGDDHRPTLELFNLNPNPRRWWCPWRQGIVYILRAGMKIGQVRFCPVVGTPEVESRGGQVRGQTSPCGNGNPKAPWFVNGVNGGGAH